MYGEEPLSQSDRSLGMDRDITRRDFINGVAMAAGSLALPAGALAADEMGAAASTDYPPQRTGMRGSHDGSFETAHQLRDSRRIDISGAERTAKRMIWLWSAAA